MLWTSESCIPTKFRMAPNNQGYPGSPDLRYERGGKVLVNPYQDLGTVYVAVFRFFTGDPNVPILNTLRLFRTLLGQLVQCESGCS